MNAWRVLLITGGGVLVASIAWAILFGDDVSPASGRDPGPAAAERFVRDYVAALNANDHGQLGRLLGRPADSTDVAARLRLYGGRGLRDLRITLTNEFPRYYVFTLRALSADGSTVRIDEGMEWSHGVRWHLPPLQPAAPSQTGTQTAPSR